MSLVNKMLNDLEGRQALFSEGHDSVLADLYAVSEEELEGSAWHRFSRGMALFIMVLLGASTIFFLNNGELLPQLEGNGIPADLRNVYAPSLAPHTPAAAFGAGTYRRPAGQAPEHGGYVALRLDAGETFLPDAGEGNTVRTAATIIKSVNLKTSGGRLYIEMGLPRETKYLIYTLDNPYRVVLDLNDSRYDGSLPDIHGMAGVRTVRQRMGQDGTYRLVVETGTPMRIDSAGIEKVKSGFSLRVNVAMTDAGSSTPATKTDAPAPAVSRAGTMEISPIVTDGVEKVRVSDDKAARIDHMVYEARKLYEDGEIGKGLNRLLHAVKLAPDNVSARATLAVLLYEQGQSKMANDILTEGLRKHPHQPEWVKILARALYSEGRIDKALALLEEAPPPIKGHLEYHALYAGILQQKEEYDRAALIYRNLLRYQSSNGAWWLGLAISLEAMSRKNDAMIAYRNALNTPQLSPESLQFVKDRLSRLNKKL
jgi:Flp pilus assembly protein TadD